MTSATTSDIPGLSGVVGAQPDAFAGQATPSSTTARAFIARSSWLAGEGRRLDASAYSSGGLAARDRIIKGAQPWQRLDQVARTFYEARFARTYVSDPARSVPYLTGSDMLLADLQGLRRLAVKKTDQLSKLLIQEGWTLLSRSGTIGRTVFVRGEMRGMVASDDVIRIAPHAQVTMPGYLFAYLTSAPAQAMIRQRTYGSVIQHIEPHHIADLPVPLPDRAMQERIHGLVAGAARARTEAACLLDEAAAYFDGLAGPMPSVHDHARAVGLVRRSKLGLRLDAFHHVGWAAEAGAPRGVRIEEIGRVTRPGIAKRIFVERGVPFVSGIDVFQTRPSHREHLMQAEADKANAFIHEGQILVQRSGQRYGLIGRPTYVGRHMDGWAASEHLMRITMNQKEHTAWVYAFLRSEVGRRTLMRTSYGTSIPELNPEGLSRIQIPPLSDALQSKARRALELRERADGDEEQAIREVEAWLNS